MRERDKGTATENFGCWRFIVYEKNQKALRGGVFINPPPPPPPPPQPPGGGCLPPPPPPPTTVVGSSLTSTYFIIDLFSLYVLFPQ